MPPSRVLCVSYDVALLTTRRLLLERAGHEVKPASSFREASAQCKKGNLNLLILGHSIPLGDKTALVRIFRAYCPAPILSLQIPGEEKTPDADYYAFSPAPEDWLQLVAAILEEHTSHSAATERRASPPAKPAPRPESGMAKKPSQSA